MLNIRIELTGEMENRFKELKNSLGLEADTEVVRFTITQSYKNLISGSSHHGVGTEG